MRLQFDARLIDVSRLDQMERWLHERCALRWAVPPRLPPAQHASALPARFVSLALLLAHGLRQWARNPAFEPGRLLFIGPIRGGLRHEARIAVPGGYGLPDQRLESIYQHAATMVLRWEQSGESGLTDSSIIDRISAILSALRGRPGVVSATSFQVLNAAWQSGLPFMGLAGGISQIGWGQRAFRSDRSNNADDGASGACAGLTRSGLTRVGLQALPLRPGMSLFERIHACLIRTDIEDLTIVVDDPSILESGLPVDRLDTVQIDLDETLSADTQWQALARMLHQLGPAVRTDARH